MNPTLQGYASAVFEAVAPEELAALADELRSIEQLVVATPALRAALTDTAVSGAVPPGRSCATSSRARSRRRPGRRPPSPSRPSPAPDVVGALDWLTLRASPPGAEGIVEPELPLSLLRARQRVGGYAQALFEPMSTGELENMEDELFRFARVIASTPALRRALVDRDLSVEARQGLVIPAARGQGAGAAPSRWCAT